METLKKDMEELKAQLKEIRDALVGNALTGDGGLNGKITDAHKRLDKAEERLDDIEAKLNAAKYFFMGVGAVAGAIGSIVVNLILKAINH